MTEAAVRPVGPSSSGLLPTERARAVTSHLALRLARRGWAVRVEVVDGGAPPQMEVRPYGPVASTHAPAPVLLPITEEPVEQQVARALRRIEQEGWVPGATSSGGWTNPRPDGAIWCVPE